MASNDNTLMYIALAVGGWFIYQHFMANQNVAATGSVAAVTPAGTTALPAGVRNIGNDLARNFHPSRTGLRRLSQITLPYGQIPPTPQDGYTWQKAGGGNTAGTTVIWQLTPIRMAWGVPPPDTGTVYHVSEALPAN